MLFLTPSYVIGHTSYADGSPLGDLGTVSPYG